MYSLVSFDKLSHPRNPQPGHDVRVQCTKVSPTPLRRDSLSGRRHSALVSAPRQPGAEAHCAEAAPANPALTALGRMAHCFRPTLGSVCAGLSVSVAERWAITWSHLTLWTQSPLMARGRRKSRRLKKEQNLSWARINAFTPQTLAEQVLCAGRQGRSRGQRTGSGLAHGAQLLGQDTECGRQWLPAEGVSGRRERWEGGAAVEGGPGVTFLGLILGIIYFFPLKVAIKIINLEKESLASVSWLKKCRVSGEPVFSYCTASRHHRRVRAWPTQVS